MNDKTERASQINETERTQVGAGKSRKKQSIIIIAQDARVKQKADSVLIISKETRQSYLISTFNN